MRYNPCVDLTDRRLLLGLTLLGGMLHVGVRVGAGLWGAMGTDAALWGLTAMDLRVGAPPLVPPAYPALVALGTLLGSLPVTAGWCISMVCAGLLPAAGFAVARTAGASRVAACSAALCILAFPDAGLWAQQVQPDAATALALLGLCGALGASLQGRHAAGWMAATIAGLLPMLREHGTPAAALAILVLLWARAWGPAALAVGLWWLGPALVGVVPGWHPADVPWSSRSAGAFHALTTTDPQDVPFIRELHREDRSRYLERVLSGDVFGRIGWHARRSVRLAWDGWLMLSAAAAGVLLARRRALLPVFLLLATAMPALLIWSQRRHVMLLVPVALVGVAVAATSRRRRLGLAAVVVAGAWTWPGAWTEGIRGLQTERFRAHHHAAAAAWLNDNAPDGSLLGGVHQDIGLYHPMPRHDPDGSPADWRTWFVGRAPPAAMPGWQRVHDSEGELDIWRLQPDVTPRPCAGGTVAPATPHLAVDRAHADLLGCETP